MRMLFVAATGVNRFASDIEEMIGYKPGPFWLLCWSVISPTFLLVSVSLFVCPIVCLCLCVCLSPYP